MVNHYFFQHMVNHPGWYFGFHLLRRWPCGEVVVSHVECFALRMSTWGFETRWQGVSKATSESSHMDWWLDSHTQKNAKFALPTWWSTKIGMWTAIGLEDYTILPTSTNIILLLSRVAKECWIRWDSGLWFELLWKIWVRQLDDYSQYMENNPNVPNHHQ